jgi:hypothetical protein
MEGLCMKKMIITLSILCMGTAFCADKAPQSQSQTAPAAIKLTAEQQDIVDAVRRGDFEAFQALVTKKIDPKFVCDSNRSLLHIAVSETTTLNIDIVKFLIETCKLDVNAKDIHDTTPLHLLACRHFCSNAMAEEVALFLIGKGANVNALNKLNTLSILRTGADDTLSYTPLDYACTSCAQTMQFLMSKGGTPRSYSKDQIGKRMFDLLKSGCSKKVQRELMLGKSVRFDCSDQKH